MLSRKMKIEFIIIGVTVILLAIGVTVILVIQSDSDEQVICEEQDILVVSLPAGKIRGRQLLTPKNVSFFAFQQIPYAAPPLGPLRFELAQPVRPWSGILNTTENTKMCRQVNRAETSENEDCLYLNIYTPQLPCERRDAKLLPVMFWIHGGGFIQGQSNYAWYGPEFFIEYGVIIVSTNYRVGPFGFLSTEDSVLPGNNGLKDQSFALKWTHDNIKLFGGDPDQITIFGQSAGSASIAYQLISQKSRGLYRAAILESGSALCAFGFRRDARKFAFKTASYLNWTESSSSQKLKDFLKTVPADDLDAASFKVFQEEGNHNSQIMQGYFYGPVLEAPGTNSFLTESMFVSLSNGDADRVPMIMGFNSEENISFETTPEYVAGVMADFDANPEWLVPDGMNIESIDEKRTIGNLIRQMYVGEDLMQNHPGVGLKYMSDMSFNRAILKHVNLQSNYSDIYFYLFDYPGRLGLFIGNIEGADRVGHIAEVSYFWRHILNSNLTWYPEQDLIVQERLLTMWTNFAKYLNPTPVKSEILQNITWPTVNSSGKGDVTYLYITEDLEIAANPKKDMYEKWDNLFTTHGKKPFITY